MEDDIVKEAIITIPFRVVKKVPKNKRAPRAMKELKMFVTKHMKPEDDEGNIIKDYQKAEKELKLYIDMPVNELIWKRGIEKPPSKIRVKVNKYVDGLVEVLLPELEE